jgi:hypothetical protein
MGGADQYTERRHVRSPADAMRGAAPVLTRRNPSATRRRRQAVLLAVLAAIVAASCRSAFSRKYEYEEDVYLNLDGSATVYVNASVPALVALRGVDLDINPRARLDRNDVRTIYQSPVTRVSSVTTSRRDNRRYLHLRLEIDNVRRLGDAPPFAWSTYNFDPRDEVVVFTQAVGASAGRDVGPVGWTGSELVAFRLHLPSRVPFHNAPSRTIERGNIIVWEQPLASRIKSEPLSIEVHMDTESILASTLLLFGLTIALAAATFALAIWWVMRSKGTSQFPVSS